MSVALSNCTSVITRTCAACASKTTASSNVRSSSDTTPPRVSIAAATHAAELRDGEVTERDIAPEEVGLDRSGLDSLEVGSVAESLATVRSVLEGKPGPASDMVALNAGATLYVAGLAGALDEGVLLARTALNSGRGAEKLAELAAFTQQFSPD